MSPLLLLLWPLVSGTPPDRAAPPLEPTAAPLAKAVPLCAPDEELVETHAGVNATAHLMRHRLRKMGTSLALNANREVLLRDFAAALRAQATLQPPATALDNPTALVQAAAFLQIIPFVMAASSALKLTGAKSPMPFFFAMSG